jgi:hypothetical protein
MRRFRKRMDFEVATIQPTTRRGWFSLFSYERLARSDEHMYDENTGVLSVNMDLCGGCGEECNGRKGRDTLTVQNPDTSCS